MRGSVIVTAMDGGNAEKRRSSFRPNAKQSPKGAAYGWFVTAIFGDSVPRTLGSISLCAQRNGRKKRAPDAALILRSAALGSTRVPRDLLSRGTVAHFLWATLWAFSQSLAVLRRGIGGLNVKLDRRSMLT